MARALELVPILVGDTVVLEFEITPTIHACFADHKTGKEQQGQLRIVTGPVNCKKSETAISWNQ